MLKCIFSALFPDKETCSFDTAMCCTDSLQTINGSKFLVDYVHSAPERFCFLLLSETENSEDQNQERERYGNVL